jgi:aminoglycoside phosphotransferase (APT) family kinase protein
MQVNEDAQFERLFQKLESGSRLLCTWELTGGVSAQVTALEIERPDGEINRVIVRRHGDVDLNRNPHVAGNEYRLLQILQTAGLATPAPYYLDRSGEIFATPYVVLEYIEGQPEFDPSNLNDLILQLATHVAGIHHLERIADVSPDGHGDLPRSTLHVRQHSPSTALRGRG